MLQIESNDDTDDEDTKLFFKLLREPMENDQDGVTVESLAANFNASGEVSAGESISRGKTVAKAKVTFDFNGFGEFCRLIKLDPKSSTCRKYRLIGAEADWLQPIVRHLPGEWTTIYLITKIGQAKAEEMISLGTLHPQVTAKQLKAAATVKESHIVSNGNAEGEPIGTADSCVFQVDASELSDQERLNLHDSLVEAAKPLGLSVTGLPDRLSNKLVIEREAA
jgi:hypothetical protein